MKEKNFYVYIYLNPLKKGNYAYPNLEISFLYEPFYVGKGKGRRCFAHLQNKDTTNKYKMNTIKSILNKGLKPIIIKYKEQLEEKISLDLERNVVKNIGRLDLHKGPLLNLTDAGDGETNHNSEYRKYRSDIMLGEKNINYKGKSINENHISKNPLFGIENGFFNKHHSNVTKSFLKNLRENDSIETKQKRSEGYKKTKILTPENWCSIFKFTTPNNEIIIVNTGLEKFIKANFLSSWTITQMLRDSSYHPKKGKLKNWKVEKLREK